MRVIVARSNSLYHPSVKNNARAKRRNVVQEMSDVSPSWRDSGHSKGYLHFSAFSTETAERSSRKNAGTSLIRRSSWLSAKASFDVGHSLKDQKLNRRSHLPDYAAWEIHPVMKLGLD